MKVAVLRMPLLFSPERLETQRDLPSSAETCFTFSVLLEHFAYPTGQLKMAVVVSSYSLVFFIAKHTFIFRAKVALSGSKVLYSLCEVAYCG